MISCSFLSERSRYSFTSYHIYCAPWFVSRGTRGHITGISFDLPKTKNANVSRVRTYQWSLLTFSCCMTQFQPTFRFRRKGLTESEPSAIMVKSVAPRSNITLQPSDSLWWFCQSGSVHYVKTFPLLSCLSKAYCFTSLVVCFNETSQA